MLHDVQFKAESETYAVSDPGEAYGTNKLQPTDWQIIKEERASLQRAADVSQYQQGSEYPTSPSVLPTQYELIDGLKPNASVSVLGADMQEAKMQPSELMAETRAARSAVHADLVDRWQTNLVEDREKFYELAAMLDPRFKNFDWVGCDGRFKFGAHAAAEAEYQLVWKLKRTSGERAATAVEAAMAGGAEPEGLASSITVTSTPESEGQGSNDDGKADGTNYRKKKRRKLNLAMILGAGAPAPVDTQPQATPRDLEMRKYLIEVPTLSREKSVLEWWRTTGAAEYPHVALMARQYLGCPATSAGVERLFSKAGRAHDSLSQSQTEGTLESKMFAGINIARDEQRRGQCVDE